MAEVAKQRIERDEPIDDEQAEDKPLHEE